MARMQPDSSKLYSYAERAIVYDREGVIQVETVEGLEIDLKEVFEAAEAMNLD
ncbi:MAG TPA: hypothetical protein GX525_09690 [Bacilli bacterium]|nr:hypothetical protein [Bacilli bacterium]